MSFAFCGGSMNVKHGVIGRIDLQYIGLQERGGYRYLKTI
jgi:hypothetical protein